MALGGAAVALWLACLKSPLLGERMEFFTGMLVYDTFTIYMRSVLLLFAVLFAIFTAYSHPAVRLKARPAAALSAIALGQGALAFALGWTVFAPVAVRHRA